MTQVAVVTGGATGIGLGIAKRLAGDGFHVAIVDIDGDASERAAAEISGGGGVAAAWRTDVSVRRDVVTCCAEVLDRWGGIHVLINNAAVMIGTPFEDISDDEWDHVLAVNLKGTFLFTQAVTPIMRRQQHGRIVNIASLAGQGGALSTSLPYAVSKAGQINLTRVLAKLLAGDGITINAVAPTATAGPRMAEAGPEAESRMASVIPVGRLAEAHEIAAAVAFLCSDEAAFITGATIDMNGGLFTR